MELSPDTTCDDAGATHVCEQDAPPWMNISQVRVAAAVLCQQCHEAAWQSGWWTDLKTGRDLRSEAGDEPRRNVPEMLCLIHSEISEAMEGYRKQMADEKLQHRPALEVELADALIRIFDMGRGLGMDLPGAMAEKLAYNARRQDHTPAARRAQGGKRF